MSHSNKRDQTTFQINDNLSEKIVYFSFITLGAMLILGIGEALYLKNYVERRKRI